MEKLAGWRRKRSAWIASTTAWSRSACGTVMGSTATTWVGRGASSTSWSASMIASRGIVGDEDRRGRPRLPHFEQQLAQPIGGALVERDERLVEQQQVGLGGEGAGKRHAARQAERQFLRVARQHVGDADRLRPDARGRPR